MIAYSISILFHGVISARFDEISNLMNPLYPNQFYFEYHIPLMFLSDHDYGIEYSVADPFFGQGGPQNLFLRFADGTQCKNVSR